MSRIKLAVALFLFIGTVAWMVTRSGKTAGAAEAEPAVQAYGENTEDVAQHRWQHNAPRHWRTLMVKR
jgi:hypothetical protein